MGLFSHGLSAFNLWDIPHPFAVEDGVFSLSETWMNNMCRCQSGNHLTTFFPGFQKKCCWNLWKLLFWQPKNTKAAKHLATVENPDRFFNGVFNSTTNLNWLQNPPDFWAFHQQKHLQSWYSDGEIWPESCWQKGFWGETKTRFAVRRLNKPISFVCPV